MQPDGNLVIYGGQMNVIWTSYTDKNPGSYLVLGLNSLKIMRSDGTVLSTLK
jgi:hypothetical protein